MPDPHRALRRARAAAQLLGPGERSAHAVVSGLLAVQAQDARAVPLALAARGALVAGGTAEQLVRTWLLRGTLHLVTAEDLPWLHALTGHLAARTARRRLAQLGVDERATAAVERALGDGPLTRDAIRERLEAAGVRADGQRTPHLLALCSASGRLLAGLDGRYALAPRPPAAVADRGAALAELARRYLRGHGPADARDLAAWSGLGLRDARAGFDAIAGELVVVGGLADLARRDPPPPELPPRLLPPFDPYLLGWRDRAFALDPAHARRVHPGGGIIRATMVADGRIVGTWRRERTAVTLEPFTPLAPPLAAAFREQRV